MIIITEISEDRKTFFYSTDKKFNGVLEVFEDNGNGKLLSKYLTNLSLSPGIRYYTSLPFRYFNMTAVFTSDNDSSETYKFTPEQLESRTISIPDETQLPDKVTDLCKMFNEYGSDKANSHNYGQLYFKYFEKFRNDKLNIFELGLGTNDESIPCNMSKYGKPGASLKAWKKFFPNSNIYGADIDGKILFSEDRIKTFYCDQTNPYVIELMWNNKELADIQFDLIVEDGLHEYTANLMFLTNSVHKLKVGGHFFVEDISLYEYEFWEKKLPELNQQFSKNYYFEFIRLSYVYGFNNLVHCVRLK